MLFNALVLDKGKIVVNEIDLDSITAADYTYIGGMCADSYCKVVIKDDCYDFIPCDKETAEKYALA